MSHFAQRLARLDFDFSRASSYALEELTRSFVAAMSELSFRGTPEDETEILDPAATDRRVADSPYMAALLEEAPWLADGPASSACTQRWVSTAKPAWVPERPREPLPEGLTPPSAARDSEASISRIGLFTSSANATYPGMWRQFLEENEVADLWPRPWWTWELVPRRDVRICSIATATDWVKLLDAHHVADEPLLRADWPSIASQFDAVHFTPHAVCAVEGLRLRASSGLTTPVYWDVECTRWLDWCFEATVLIAVDDV